MENVEFEFYKGRTYIRDFSITGWTPKIDKMYFTIKENVTDKNYVIQKTLNDDITCTDEGIDENGEVYREFNLLINATDTDYLEINKKYVFDVAIVSNGIKRTVMTGTLKLKGTATHTHNERR